MTKIYVREVSAQTWLLSISVVAVFNTIYTKIVVLLLKLKSEVLVFTVRVNSFNPKK